MDDLREKCYFRHKSVEEIRVAVFCHFV